MKDKIFIDTNIFVYAFLNDKNESEKHKKARQLLSSFDLKDEIIISTQVCSEYYSALSKNKISDNEIQSSLKELINVVNVASITKGIVLQSFNLKNRYKYSYWDSLILSTGINNRHTILYSEDLQHKHMIENNLVITNPFLV